MRLQVVFFPFCVADLNVKVKYDIEFQPNYANKINHFHYMSMPRIFTRLPFHRVVSKNHEVVGMIEVTYYLRYSEPLTFSRKEWF